MRIENPRMPQHAGKRIRLLLVGFVLSGLGFQRLAHGLDELLLLGPQMVVVGVVGPGDDDHRGAGAGSRGKMKG